MGPGRSSDLGSSAPRPFRIAPVDFRGASPFTAAGPFRIRTCFPFARRTRRNPCPSSFEKCSLIIHQPNAARRPSSVAAVMGLAVPDAHAPNQWPSEHPVDEGRCAFR